MLQNFCYEAFVYFIAAEFYFIELLFIFMMKSRSFRSKNGEPNVE